MKEEFLLLLEHGVRKLLTMPSSCLQRICPFYREVQEAKWNTEDHLSQAFSSSSIWMFHCSLAIRWWVENVITAMHYSQTHQTLWQMMWGFFSHYSSLMELMSLSRFWVEQVISKETLLLVRRHSRYYENFCNYQFGKLEGEIFVGGMN